jgi:carbon-monoxide dehydrogenase medium subunit
MNNFEYLEVKSVRATSALLAQYEGKAKVLAGGTDLLVAMKRRWITPEYVINIKRIPGLDYVRYGEREGLKVGALATLHSLECSPIVQQRFPVLAIAISKMASLGIRNMATIGGNLCNASPAADTAPALIGLGALIKVEGPTGKRLSDVEEFFLGPGQNALQSDEVLTEIQIPNSPSRTRGVYLKLSRTAADLAIVGVTFFATFDSKHSSVIEAKIVLGAVGPTPMRARQAEVLIKGKGIKDVPVEKAAEIAAAEAKPISDVRASADYRQHMVKVMTAQAIRQVLTDE